MDGQTMVNIGAGTCLAIIGWLARQLWQAVQSLQEAVHRVEIDLPKNYVAKHDLTLTMAEIKETLIRLEVKLDGKVGK